MSSEPNNTPLRAERDRLERAVLTLLRAQGAQGADAGSSDAGEPAESRERLAHTGERTIWVLQDAAGDALAREVGAYTRALRVSGLAARAAATAVSAVVRETATPFIDGAPLDVMVHDAGRDCINAYYAT
jgi:hypothetical protein